MVLQSSREHFDRGGVFVSHWVGFFKADAFKNDTV